LEKKGNYPGKKRVGGSIRLREGKKEADGGLYGIQGVKKMKTSNQRGHMRGGTRVKIRARRALNQNPRVGPRTVGGGRLTWGGGEKKNFS